MRVKFEFREFPQECRELQHLQIWINKFPCRLHNGDMIMSEILGAEYNAIIKDNRGDHPEVACFRFDVDNNGYYQNVWLNV